MNKYKNSQKTAFLKALPESSIESDKDLLATKSKFNFGYFQVQSAGQDFADWDHSQLVKLLEKLRDYSREPLSYWKNQRIGAGSGRVLSIYGGFPLKSDFSSPSHVPIEAQWGRFRLESAVRLVGFVVPDKYHQTLHKKTGYFLDANTFYVVFLDRNHAFYKIEDS